MSKRDLLIEIGTEELPPKSLSTLSNAFTQGIEIGLKDNGLHYQACESFATPRRLAVVIYDLDEAQADIEGEKRGPALSAAFDAEGNPTKALIGFARSCGTEPDKLEKLETPKGNWMVHRYHQKGRAATELIPDIVNYSLNQLPIPKRMRWGDLDAEFVRPVHWLVLLFGHEIIQTEILSQHSGNQSRGHRYHHPQTITIESPGSYQKQLMETGLVIASFSDRREAIRQQVNALAHQHKGIAVIDEGLLDEVTGLVEWPQAIIGTFDKSFLEVPSECLISAMKGHQKYFHLIDESGQLLPLFITVSNINSSKPEYVKQGNERVITPRLTDAKFFWDQDKKLSLQSYKQSLATVVFQNQLGTLLDKTQRVEILSASIANQIGADVESATTAASLSKCDLMTMMVYEFTELQGIMGRYYALNEGYSDEIATSLDEIYMPRGAGDDLPSTTTGQVIALADRLDTLLAIFAIGQKPSGTRDPFALRRASLGVLRILIEKGLDLDLYQLLQTAAQNLKDQVKVDNSLPKGFELLEGGDAVNQTFDYIVERLKAYYNDQGIDSSVVEAVLALRHTNPMTINAAVHAVTQFAILDEAASLSAANKRISNILKKQGNYIDPDFDRTLFTETAETTLADAIESLVTTVEPLFVNRNYTDGLKALAQLRNPVDNFFDQVMVMVDDEAVKNNRLALLNQLRNLFLRVADLSLLQISGK